MLHKGVSATPLCRSGARQGLFVDRLSLLVYFDAAFRKERLKRPAANIHHDVIYNGPFPCIAAKEIIETAIPGEGVCC